MRWMVEEELDSWACHFHRWRYDVQCTHPAVDVQITAAVVECDAYNLTQKNILRT